MLEFSDPNSILARPEGPKIKKKWESVVEAESLGFFLDFTNFENTL